MTEPGKYDSGFMHENGFDVEYMTDEEMIERCGGERGEITSARIYAKDGTYDRDGLFSERVFGPEKGAVCSCGKVHTKGLWCSDCGHKAENGWKTRLGWIRLPVGWYGNNRDLVADLLGCSPAALDACWSGNAPVNVGGKRILGPQQIESCVARANVSDAVERLEGLAEQTEAMLAEKGREDYKDLENKLEGYELRIAALRAMEPAGLRPKDLMRHVMPVMPPWFRRMSEVGSDPEGRLNRTYIDVLSKSSRLSAAMETWRNAQTEEGRAEAAARFRSEAMSYANSLRAAIQDSDLLGDKKGLGRASQKFRVPDSFSAPAIADKNLRIDQVSLPYRILVRMYRKELEEELRKTLSEADPQMSSEEIRQAARLLTSSQMERIPPSKRNETVVEALRRVLKGKLVLLDRFPNVTGNSFVALEPVIGAGDSCIGANPLICEQMKLDFDGDMPNVIKITSKKAIEDARRYLWPGVAQNSVVTGAPLHMMEREDTWGIWLMTRAWPQSDMSFRRDALITGMSEREKDGVPTGETAIYARHIIAELPDDFIPGEMPEIFGKGDVIGHDSKGNEIKAPGACMMQEVDGKPRLLSIPQDCIVIPPGTEIPQGRENLVGRLIQKDTMIARIPQLSFDSLEQAKEAYGKHAVNAFTPIKVTLGQQAVTTTMGRLMISELLSPPGTFRLFNGQMNKKNLDKAFTRLWNRAMALAENENAVLKVGGEFLDRLKAIQDLSVEFSRDYGSFSTYDAFKFEGVDAKGVPEDLYFRSNSLLDQIRSGAKGSMNNIRLFIKFTTGLDPLKDAQFIADEVQKLDKGGKPVEGKMKPVEEAGMWQRFFAEAGSSFIIEKEDCGTTASEKVPVPPSESETADAVSMLRNRNLAEDYTSSSGRTWYAGDAIGDDDADLIARDMAATGRQASVRTLMGCLCTGGCSKCYGLDPSDLRPIRPGARIGIIAGNAFTSELREKMTLKATANSGREGDATATAVFGKIMEGDPRVWQAAIDRGPEGAARMTARLLDDLFRKQAGIDVSRQNMEVAAKMMVGVHVRGTDDDGKRINETCSFGRWIREFKGKKGVSVITRIRSMRRIAEGSWGSDNAAHIVALGGTRGPVTLAAESIIKRGTEKGGRSVE